jgi:hypothetical protein
MTRGKLPKAIFFRAKLIHENDQNDVVDDRPIESEKKKQKSQKKTGEKFKNKSSGSARGLEGGIVILVRRSRLIVFKKCFSKMPKLCLAYEPRKTIGEFHVDRRRFMTSTFRANFFGISSLELSG